MGFHHCSGNSSFMTATTVPVDFPGGLGAEGILECVQNGPHAKGNVIKHI